MEKDKSKREGGTGFQPLQSFSKLPDGTDRGGHELNQILQKDCEIINLTY
jgi:hypothetical protein